MGRREDVASARGGASARWFVHRPPEAESDGSVGLVPAHTAQQTPRPEAHQHHGEAHFNDD